MSQATPSLGILVSAEPAQANFRHALHLAEAALRRGWRVYLYCIDAAVAGAGEARLLALQERGLRLFACAYAAQRRRLTMEPSVAYAGLGVVSDLMSGTDRFVSFN